MPIYFASDFHLGIDAKHSTQERERRVVAWLEHCRQDAEAVYLVGDLFEFWFEWKRVIPKGYVRFLGKLAELVDQGIDVHVFTGNHDMWLFDYLETEIGVKLHRQPIEITLQGKNFLIGHGDGLGPGDHGYKRLKKLFAFKPAQWLLARFHPNFTMWIAYFWSGFSRSSQPAEAEFLGAEKEWLAVYSEKKLAQNPSLDYCIFGHRHLPIDHTLSNGRSRYLNLGEWLHYYTYVRLEDGECTLLTWK
ncbi:UDP-2,3-diacylglucosamine hydrolase [Lewinellaceae bacterium SD302]|nr:UDP-2,3-diacylglucosamine hydrolase [Lewinellaceae bacterium SD302]